VFKPMIKPSFFRPGQTVVIREVCQGKLLEVRPEILVKDSPEITAFYLAPGTIYKKAFDSDEKEATIQDMAALNWLLIDSHWPNFHRLRLTIPGTDCSVLLFWKHPEMSFEHYYINLEEPFRRTPIGFDYTDQFLDILPEHDLSDWHWKDEDELQEAIALGVVSPERAAAMRVEGEKVARWLQSGKSPFNGWEKWRPDPLWKIPVLPEGWDKVKG
jgi:predicted RNA-binding protein associated with RNAse of E/G family